MWRRIRPSTIQWWSCKPCSLAIPSSQFGLLVKTSTQEAPGTPRQHPEKLACHRKESALGMGCWDSTWRCQEDGGSSAFVFRGFLCFLLSNSSDASHKQGSKVLSCKGCGARCYSPKPFPVFRGRNRSRIWHPPRACELARIHWGPPPRPLFHLVIPLLLAAPQCLAPCFQLPETGRLSSLPTSLRD